MTNPHAYIDGLTQQPLPAPSSARLYFKGYAAQALSTITARLNARAALQKAAASNNHDNDKQTDPAAAEIMAAASLLQKRYAVSIEPRLAIDIIINAAAEICAKNRPCFIIAANDDTALHLVDRLSQQRHRLPDVPQLVRADQDYQTRKAAYQHKIIVTTLPCLFQDYVASAPRLFDGRIHQSTVATKFGSALSDRLIDNLGHILVVDTDRTLLEQLPSPLTYSRERQLPDFEPHLRLLCELASDKIGPDDYLVDPGKTNAAFCGDWQTLVAPLQEKFTGCWQSSSLIQVALNGILTAKHCHQQGETYCLSDDKVLPLDKQSGKILTTRNFPDFVLQALQLAHDIPPSPLREITFREAYSTFLRRCPHVSALGTQSGADSFELAALYQFSVADFSHSRALWHKQQDRRNLHFDTKEQVLAMLQSRDDDWWAGFDHICSLNTDTDADLDADLDAALSALAATKQRTITPLRSLLDLADLKMGAPSPPAAINATPAATDGSKSILLIGQSHAGRLESGLRRSRDIGSITQLHIDDLANASPQAYRQQQRAAHLSHFLADLRAEDLWIGT